MTADSASAGASGLGTHKLVRRDYILLPLLSLATVTVLFVFSEIVTRVLWPQVDQDVCFVNDPVAGYRFRPHCVSTMKSAEGPWTTNRYNECGYRTYASCGPKPAHTVRLALLGSSVVQGLFVPYEETFATRSAESLAKTLRRPVEVQNLGVFDSSPLYVYRRLEETIALGPDAVVFALSPWDLEQKMDRTLLAERNDPNARFSRTAASAELGVYKRLQFLLLHSRSVLIAQHFLFQNTDTFLRLYLAYGDKADFLREPLTPAWQQRFADLRVLIHDMRERLSSRGVLLVVMAVPSRAEAALLSERIARPGVDARGFGARIARIAHDERAADVDLMTAFRNVPHSERLFYTVDGHLTPEGHALVAQQLTRTLSGVLSASEAAR